MKLAQLINMLYFLKYELSYYTPISHNDLFSVTAATFFCPQGGRCEEKRLY